MDQKKLKDNKSESIEHQKKKKRSRSPKKEKKKQKSKKSKERKSDKDKKKSDRKKNKSPKKKSERKEKSDKPKVEQNVETKEQRISRLKDERRRKSRSNSAVRHYQKQILANNPQAKANSLGYDKQDSFWDGFAWVPKTNLHDKVRDDKDKVMSLTSRMRRIQICNIPTGLTNRDLYAELSRFMNRNYLNDVGNAKPILHCHLNEKDRTCTLELSSVEESNRMLKLEEIKLLDESCKVLRLGESLYGQSVNQSQLVQQAHNMAQAQAAAFLALKTLGYAKGQRAEDEILAQAGIPSRIIKVGNFLNAAMAINLNRNEWNEMREDLLEGFSQFGHIEDEFFVKPFQAGLGAEAGSLFIIYSNKDEAQKTVCGMYGRTYNQRPLKIIFINEQTYIRAYVPLKLKLPPDGEEFQYQAKDEYDNYYDEPYEDEEEQQNQEIEQEDDKKQIFQQELEQEQVQNQEEILVEQEQEQESEKEQEQEQELAQPQPQPQPQLQEKAQAQEIEQEIEIEQEQFPDTNQEIKSQQKDQDDKLQHDILIQEDQEQVLNENNSILEQQPQQQQQQQQEQEVDNNNCQLINYEINIINDKDKEKDKDILTKNNLDSQIEILQINENIIEERQELINITEQGLDQTKPENNEQELVKEQQQ